MAALSSAASLTVTANPFRIVEASSSLAVTTEILSSPSSVGLRYVGSDPIAEQSNVLSTKKYADSYFENNSLVDQKWINAQADQYVGNLRLQSNVDSEINALNSTGGRVYPTIAQLNTTLGLYPDGTSFDVPNGLALADANGMLLSTQVPPNIKTDNTPVFINCITDSSAMIYLNANFVAISSSFSSDPVGTGGNKAANVTISDPGYDYYPMSFVYVRGRSSGTSQQRLSGTGNMGQITVAAAPATGQVPTVIFSQGVCAATPYQNWHVALPTANRWTSGPPVTAQTNALVRGRLTLNLYLTNYQGSGYTFYPEGLMWYVILFPTKTFTTLG